MQSSGIKLELWHPSMGVTQVNVTLGIKNPTMRYADARKLFVAIPEVTGTGIAGGMWANGAIDLQLYNGFMNELPPALEAKLTAICRQIVAAGSRA